MKISFLSSLSFVETPSSLSHRLIAWAEGLISKGTTHYQITKSEGRTYTCMSQNLTPSAWRTLRKVALYATVVLPLIALAIKGIFRATHTFNSPGGEEVEALRQLAAELPSTDIDSNLPSPASSPPLVEQPPIADRISDLTDEALIALTQIVQGETAPTAVNRQYLLPMATQIDSLQQLPRDLATLRGQFLDACEKSPLPIFSFWQLRTVTLPDRQSSPPLSPEVLHQELVRGVHAAVSKISENPQLIAQYVKDFSRQRHWHIQCNGQPLTTQCAGEQGPEALIKELQGKLTAAHQDQSEQSATRLNHLLQSLLTQTAEIPFPCYLGSVLQQALAVNCPPVQLAQSQEHPGRMDVRITDGLNNTLHFQYQREYDMVSTDAQESVGTFVAKWSYMLQRNDQGEWPEAPQAADAAYPSLTVTAPEYHVKLTDQSFWLNDRWWTPPLSNSQPALHADEMPSPPPTPSWFGWVVSWLGFNS